MILATITEGWTEELPAFTLLANGVPQDLTGMTVALVLRDGNGALVTIAGTTRVDASPSTGKVYYAPASTDLSAARSAYSVHWRVTDGAGKVAFFPNGTPDSLAVVPA